MMWISGANSAKKEGNAILTVDKRWIAGWKEGEKQYLADAAIIAYLSMLRAKNRRS
jgi:hypothetical protein